MMRRWALGTKQGMAVGIAALLLCVGLASPREAAAKHTCKVSQTLVRVDTKSCKPNRFRPAYRAGCDAVGRLRRLAEEWDAGYAVRTRRSAVLLNLNLHQPSGAYSILRCERKHSTLTDTI